MVINCVAFDHAVSAYTKMLQIPEYALKQPLFSPLTFL